MPDYNAAVAAGIQPPQGLDFGRTLSTVADWQRAQAATALSQLQALQVQRKYNGVLATQQALANHGSPSQAFQAGVAAGADPQDISNALAAASTANFMGGHNNLAPPAAEAVANIGRIGAQTANERAQLPGFQAKSEQENMQLRGGIAQSLAADTSDDNWKSTLPQLSGHVSPQGWAQILDAYKNPEKRPQVAKNMIAAALPPADATKLEQYDATKGITSPLTRLGAAPQQGAALGGQPAMSPQAETTQKGFGIENVADLKAANARYDTAAGVQSGLLQLENHLDEIPQTGWFAPGKDAGKRIALAKAVNTAMSVAGGNPIFDPNTVASAEATQKGTTKLGFDLAKTLGSREAAMIVQQSIGVQPGVEMTPQGNRRIITGLMAAAQRDKDYGQFVQQYMKQNPNMVPGEANTAFNQAHPPTEYVNAVNKILSIDPKYVKLLRDNPSKAADFDAKFNSPGISRFLIGG